MKLLDGATHERLGLVMESIVDGFEAASERGMAVRPVHRVATHLCAVIRSVVVGRPPLLFAAHPVCGGATGVISGECSPPQCADRRDFLASSRLVRTPPSARALAAGERSLPRATGR